MPLQRIVRRDLHRLQYCRAILPSAPVTLRTKFKNVSLDISSSTRELSFAMKTTLLTPRGYRRRSKSRIFAQKGQRARFPLPHDACVGAKKPLEVLESRD